MRERLDEMAAPWNKAFAALQASNDLLMAQGAALRHATVGVALVGVNGQPLYFNDVLVELFGYTHETMPGPTFLEITHPDDRAIDLELYLALERGEIAHYTIHKRWFDVDKRIVSGHLTVIQVAGQPYVLALVFPDANQHKVEEARGFLPPGALQPPPGSALPPE